jgi:UDP-GlcNAc3NAcA epimerase
MVKLVTVLGNRPQFVKAAIVGRRWREHWPGGELSEYLVHTGQHYDPMLSDVFFEQLGIAAPDVNLQLGSGPILDQIGAMLPLLRKVFEEQQPDGVLVYGDTNSTVAAALAAAHLHIPLFHVEAGERNYRRRLAPEEINRVVTDELAWLCLTSTEKATEYLLREGYHPGRVVRVGDPMYDLFCWATPLVDENATVTPASLGLEAGRYVLATIHRQENTASNARLVAVLDALDAVNMPVVLPVHPRVRNMLQDLGWSAQGSLRLIDPVGYFDVLSLLRDCAVCVTDSGGLSREAFFAGKPSVVPLPNSGWNEIVEAGWLKVEPRAGAALTEAIENFRPTSPLPQGLFGDGMAAVHLGKAILAALGGRGEEGAWHPLGPFEAIPQPVDRSGRGYGRFRDAVEAMAAVGRRFVPLGELAHAGEGLIGLRHDVAWSLDDAAAFAAMEAELGVRATYFIRTDGEAFNPWSARNRALIAGIAANGHEIGVLADGEAAPHAKLLEQITGAPAAAAPDGVAEVALEAAAACPGPSVVSLDPSLWAAIPMSPFEKGQRIVADAARRLGGDPQLADWMRR